MSVIVPHLNEPNDLHRCLSSLEAQKRAGIPFEVIVVDNGSRISPAAVCAPFEDVRLVHELTPGPGPARNFGARLAKGEILAFIDADCIAMPGWLSGIVAVMTDPGVDIVAGEVRIGRAIEERPTGIELYESVFSYRTKHYAERHHYAATGNMAVRARTFSAVGPFGGITVMEDTDWGQRATSMGYRVKHAPEVCVITPACRSDAELTRRLDRHIAHEFHNLSGGRARWLFRMLMIAVSPLAAIPTLLFSEKVSGWRQRAIAFAYLVRLRLYRARKMLDLLCSRDAAARITSSWNRDAHV